VGTCSSGFSAFSKKYRCCDGLSFFGLAAPLADIK